MSPDWSATFPATAGQGTYRFSHEMAADSNKMHLTPQEEIQNLPRAQASRSQSRLYPFLHLLAWMPSGNSRAAALGWFPGFLVGPFCNLTLKP